jgi:hypothetical protein
MGKPTITKCPICKTPIKGDYYNPNIIDLTTFESPKFCRGCGKLFPWTETKLNAAKEVLLGE